MGYKDKIFSGIKWNFVASFSISILSILQLSVLARYIDKKDFGIVAIIMIIISFTQIFLDMGISSAIMHKQSISDKELNSLYWLNVILGFLLYVIIFLASPLIANFYNIDELSFFIKLVGLSLIIQSFSKQFLTLFEKEMKFDLISKIQVFSSLVASILSISMAINGFGIYSLVIPNIINSIIFTVLIFYYGVKCFYFPKLYFNYRETKYYINFGIFITFSSILNYINSKSDELLIGKLLGAQNLGLYSISKNLVWKPAYIINPIITRVFMPYFAKIQHEEEKIRETYLKLINLVATINFFIYLLIILYSALIVKILLGQNWKDAIKIIQILSIYLMLRATGNPVGVLTVSKGKPKLEFYWSILYSFIIPSMILISSRWGIEGIAWGWVVVSLILSILNYLFLVKPLCNAGFIEYMGQIIRPGIFVIIILIIYNLLKFNLNELSSILVSLFIIPISYLVYNYIVNRGLMGDILTFIKELVFGKSREGI